MAYDPIALTEVAQDKFATSELMVKFKNRDDYLYSCVGGNTALLQNGSFEIDSDSDGAPDSWDLSLYSGGSYSLNTSVPAHGAKCLAFVHPGGSGNGGGYATSTYFEVDALSPLLISGIHWATAAGMLNGVYVMWYTAAKVHISDSGAWESSSNPTSAKRESWLVFPPSAGTARYAKLFIAGGIDTVNVAGTAYFDGFSVSPCLTLPCFANPADTFTPLVISGSVNTTQTSYTKVREFVCTVSGALRIAFTLSALSGGTAYGRIYRNGTAVGTARSTTSTGGVTYSEDISGWCPGDLLQFYAHTNNASYNAYITNPGVSIDILSLDFLTLL